MQAINRRRALTVVAAVPAAVALGNVPSSSAASEFADWIMLTLNTDLYEPEIPKGATVIFDPDLTPRDDGDLVLVSIQFKGERGSELILPFERRSGHDYAGRFCKRGDPREIIGSLGCIVYSRADFDRHVTLFGAARGWISL